MIVIEFDRPNGFTIVRASGVLTVNDYKSAVPEIEHAIVLAGKPLRVLLRLEDFRGWEVGALWEELKFDLRHRSDTGRIAVIGDTKLEEWGTAAAAVIAAAEIRFFGFDQEAEARRWLRDAKSV